MRDERRSPFLIPTLEDAAGDPQDPWGPDEAGLVLIDPDAMGLLRSLATTAGELRAEHEGQWSRATVYTETLTLRYLAVDDQLREASYRDDQAAIGALFEALGVVYTDGHGCPVSEDVVALLEELDALSPARGLEVGVELKEEDGAEGRYVILNSSSTLTHGYLRWPDLVAAELGWVDEERVGEVFTELARLDGWEAFRWANGEREREVLAHLERPHLRALLNSASPRLREATLGLLARLEGRSR